MKTLTHISAGSVGKLLGLIYFALFGVGGIIVFVGATIFRGFQMKTLLICLAAPFFYGILGAVGAYLMCVAYNWGAKMVGGIRFRVEEKAAE